MKVDERTGPRASVATHIAGSIAVLLGAVACGGGGGLGPDSGASSDAGTTTPNQGDASAEVDGGGTPGGGTPDAGTPTGGEGSPTTFNVFDKIPQFGIYSTTEPAYTPPAGVLMWSFGTVFATKLTPAQQSQIGASLAARITYHAQCDNYDRLGGLFFIAKPKGELPQATDPRTEIVRFITPFSNYKRGALATHVYPDADLSVYASTLADASKDVWLGIAGGSNPYDGDPCTNAGVAADFAAVGFKYSVDLVARGPAPAASSVTLTAVASVTATSTPVAGTFTNPGGALTGHVTVIVSGHGSAAGGDEYRHTVDTVTVNGENVGTFDTQIDCAPFAKYSPDGNPGIFSGNTTTNPRNWCPGALVPSHSFPATLKPGANDVQLAIAPATVPKDSYYATSIHFSTP